MILTLLLIAGYGKKMVASRLAALVMMSTACILTPVRAATDPTDVEALNVMYSWLNSPSQLTKWTSSGGDPCGDSWLGVICSGPKVTQLHLTGLGLSGALGYRFENMFSLTYIDISDNNFRNDLPYNFPPNLRQVNFSCNSFTGNIPFSIYALKSLEFLNLSHNQLQGQLLDNPGYLFSLSTLDLSFNSFSSELPHSFSQLSSITNMFLQNNMFCGSIDVLANLPLRTLNIANNHFTGCIPSQLQQINLIKDGNLFNTGPAPPPPPGTPLPPNGIPVAPPGTPPETGTESRTVISLSKSNIRNNGIVGIVISIFVVGAIVMVRFNKKLRSRQPSSNEEKRFFNMLCGNGMHVMSIVNNFTEPRVNTYETPASVGLKCPPLNPCKPTEAKKRCMVDINLPSFSIADLRTATWSFSADILIGEGSFGRVYRAQFDDGKVLAVKKIYSSLIPEAEDFLEMVSSLSRLHHPNVSELVGYCSEHNQHLLVFEFHKNGSLHDFLHLSEEYKTTPLTWDARVNIALGTARALQYLHESCTPPVIHKSFKSENILLDSELNPRLTGCGLASLIPNADQILSQDLGSGYAAPEVFMSRQYSIKSDVYTFGVLMLELFTGRKPYDGSRPRAEQSLVMWATPHLHNIDALARMADPELNGHYSVESLAQFANVVAQCLQADPEIRPPVSEVVESLERLVIEVTYLPDSSSSIFVNV